MHGNARSAIQCYNDLMRQRTEKRAALLSGGTEPFSLAIAQGSRQGTQEASICEVRFYDKGEQQTTGVESGDSLTIELEYRLEKPLADLALTLGIYNEAEVNCFEVPVSSTLATFGPLSGTGMLRCHFPQLPLLPGCYYANVGFYPPNWEYSYDYHWQMHPFTVEPKVQGRSQTTGVVSLSPQWSVQDTVSNQPK